MSGYRPQQPTIADVREVQSASENGAFTLLVLFLEAGQMQAREAHVSLYGSGVAGAIGAIELGLGTAAMIVSARFLQHGEGFATVSRAAREAWINDPVWLELATCYSIGA